jgi:hypothetical protein
MTKLEATYGKNAVSEADLMSHIMYPKVPEPLPLRSPITSGQDPIACCSSPSHCLCAPPVGVQGLQRERCHVRGQHHASDAAVPGFADAWQGGRGGD